MDFKKKLKVRLYTAIAFFIIGAALIVLPFALHLDNESMSPFGLALIVVGIVQLRQYRRITKSEDTLRKQEILETDERNLYISRKAKSIAFSCCLLLTCVAVIVLQCLEIEPLATALSLSVYVQLLFYWVTYFILQKRS